jgi:hypothetical protein
MQRMGTYTLCIIENQMLLGSFDMKYKVFTLKGNMFDY